VAKLMNDVFWDEKEGMYFDRNEKTGKRVYVKSATNFMVLFAGAATPERAKRMIHEHLMNADEFWLTYPVASYAKTEPDYYQGAHSHARVQLARFDVGADELHDIPRATGLRVSHGGA
jgi:putative isomerase